MLDRTGVATEKDLEKAVPSKQRLSKGPVAVIECFQEIPCDPCSAACPFGAIKAFADINNLPEIDFDKCTGCAICVSACPGLAIFVIDENYSNNEALIKLPYEMIPLPKKGEEVDGLDRSGNIRCSCIVEKVAKTKNKTSIVSVIVPKSLSMEIRNIRVRDKNNER